jgi:hypothetical protein
MITKIELIQTLDSMGKRATADDLSNWCKHLRVELKEQFVDAVIVFHRLPDKTPSKIHVEAEGEDENTAKYIVEKFINHTWNEWS